MACVALPPICELFGPNAIIKQIPCGLNFSTESRRFHKTVVAYRYHIVSHAELLLSNVEKIAVTTATWTASYPRDGRQLIATVAGKVKTTSVQP